MENYSEEACKLVFHIEKTFSKSISLQEQYKQNLIGIQKIIDRAILDEAEYLRNRHEMELNCSIDINFQSEIYLCTEAYDMQLSRLKK